MIKWNLIPSNRMTLWLGVAVLTLLSACARQQATVTSASRNAEYEMVTLLPRDGIPAIDNPRFLTAGEADPFYDADELVIGVDFAGDARAYSIPLLSNHEIVNDTVGGVKIAVTW